MKKFHRFEINKSIFIKSNVHLKVTRDSSRTKAVFICVFKAVFICVLKSLEIESKMTFDIRVDFENNPGGIFYAGQLLSGIVRLTLSEEKTVRGVYIRIYGKAYCRWTSGSGKNRVTYVGQENYLNQTTYLVGSSEGIVFFSMSKPNRSSNCTFFTYQAM